MTDIESTIDEQEVNKFAQHAKHWWDPNGPLKTLHDINNTRLEFVSQHIPLKGIHVLDVGCGGGILCEAMAHAGAYVTGIDAEKEAIEIAKQHAQDNQFVIEYWHTPIEDYDERTFDVITCMEMLEHVQNPQLVLQHCKRLLKPGGLLFLSTISRTLRAYASAIFAAEYILNIVPRQTHEYKKFIKPSELMSMTRVLELTLLDMKGLHYNPFSRQTSLSSKVDVNYLMALQG